MFKKQVFPETVLQSIANNKDVYLQGMELSQDPLAFKEVQVNPTERKITFNIQTKSQEKVEISFLKNGIASMYSCTCAPFQEYAGACEHVVASMEYLNHHTVEELIQKQSESLILGDVQNKIQKNKRILEQLLYHSHEDLKSPSHFLQFEYILNLNQLPNQPIQAGLYLRVGIDYLYVVRDFSTVLRFLTNEREYSFGKQFTYRPTEHQISDSDMRLLKKLNEIDQLEFLYLKEADRMNADQPPLRIPPSYVEEVLELMQETSFAKIRWGFAPNNTSEIVDKDLHNFRLSSKEKLPLNVRVKKESDHYEVLIKTKAPEVKIHFLEQTDLLRVDNQLVKIDSDREKELISRLISTTEVLKDDSLYLNEYQMTEFLSLFLPLIEKYFYLEMDSEIYQLVVDKEFKTKLFINYNQNQLRIEPVFTYGEIKVYPLDSDKNQDLSHVVLRDFSKENRVLKDILTYLTNVQIDDSSWYYDDFNDLSRFLYENFIELDEKYPVYLSEEVQKLVYRPQNQPRVYVNRQSNSNLLDVHFELEDITPQELSQIVHSIQSEQRFYRLDSGKIIDTEDDKIHEVFQAISDLGLEDQEIESDEMTVPLVKGLAAIQNPLVRQGKELTNLVHELKNPSDLNILPPKNLNAELRAYQETGFKWLKTMDHYGFGAVLADDMGLGKTLQAITFILSKWEEQGGKYLVVCPSSVMYNWKAEIERFAPILKPKIIVGQIGERQKLLEAAMDDEETAVIISSYPLIHRDVGHYKKYFFKSIVLDESQNIKNINTKTSRAIKHLQSENIVALSGTPIENNLNELWALFSTVQPGLFKSQKDFMSLSAEEISRKISFFILRRLKEEVLQDLPPKTETEQFIELSEDQKRMYQVQLAMIRQEIDEYVIHDTFEKNRIQILAGMTRLRQICNDPRLVDPNFKGESAKLERLLEFLDESQKNHKRIVIFSQFTTMLSLIRQELDKQGRDYHYLDGQTDKKQRLELTERFNNGEKDLFLISLKAGGVGINLTGGDTVILYDSWWNPAIEDQATDRVHRFGQKKPVQVLRLITKGTIEEKIYDLQEQKRRLVDSVIQSDSEPSIHKLSSADIIKLLTE